MARRAPTADAPEQPTASAAIEGDAPAVEERSDAAAGAEPAAAAEAPRRRGRPPGRRRAPEQPSQERGTAPSSPAATGRHSGAETHAAVKRLLQSGSLTHTQAFERLAAESGRRPSAISAAYYRVERAARDQAPKPERRRSAAPAAVRPDPDETRAALAAVRAAIDQLAAAVERQERELARAEAERERYARIRDIVGADLASAPAGRRRRR